MKKLLSLISVLFVSLNLFAIDVLPVLSLISPVFSSGVNVIELGEGSDVSGYILANELIRKGITAEDISSPNILKAGIAYTRLVSLAADIASADALSASGKQEFGVNEVGPGFARASVNLDNIFVLYKSGSRVDSFDADGIVNIEFRYDVEPLFTIDLIINNLDTYNEFIQYDKYRITVYLDNETLSNYIDFLFYDSETMRNRYRNYIGSIPNTDDFIDFLIYVNESGDSVLSALSMLRVEIEHGDDIIDLTPVLNRILSVESILKFFGVSI